MNPQRQSYKSRNLLLVVSLRPDDPANPTGIREKEAKDFFENLCVSQNWDYKHDYIYLSTSAGGERWAQDKANKRRVRDLRRGFSKRMQFTKPDLILISGKFTALEFCRALKDLMWSRSTVSQLYRCNFEDTLPRKIITPSWNSPVKLIPNLGFFGCESIRRARLPTSYWGRMLVDVRKEITSIDKRLKVLGDCLL
jgi:hypothetical protein